MSPPRHDIDIVQSQTFSETFAYREDDLTTPISLVGATAKAQIRKRPGSTLLEEFTVVVDGALGEVMISLTGDETQVMEVVTAEYDVLVTRSDMTRFVLVEGKVKIDGTVTEVSA